MGRKVRKSSAAERTVSMRFMRATRKELPGVRYVTFQGARHLLTIRLTDAIPGRFGNDSIVRIAPEADDTDEAISALKSKLEAMGARAFVLPRPRDKVLPEQRVANVQARGMREVVTALIAESAYEDKEILGEFIEEILSSEGL